MLQFVVSVDISESYSSAASSTALVAFLLWNGNQNNVFMLIYESIYVDRCPLVRSSARPLVRSAVSPCSPSADLHVIHALKTMNDLPFVFLLCAAFQSNAKLFNSRKANKWLWGFSASFHSGHYRESKLGINPFTLHNIYIHIQLLWPPQLAGRIVLWSFYRLMKSEAKTVFHIQILIEFKSWPTANWNERLWKGMKAIIESGVKATRSNCHYLLLPFSTQTLHAAGKNNVEGTRTCCDLGSAWQQWQQHSFRFR